MIKLPFINPSQHIAVLPLVSIVMSTYNGDAYLPQQLDTIIQQTYPNLEIIILDDGSTDGTVALLQRYQLSDPRIQFFQNEKNLGPNKSFEKGMKMATGAFIAISDQDDIWELNKIETMLKEWPQDALFVYCLPGRFTNDDFASRQPIRNWHHSDMNDHLKLVFNTPISGHASMFKRELLDYCLPFPADVYYDWWLSMHAAQLGGIGFIPKTLAWQRVHENNFSLQVYRMSKEEKQEKLREQWIHLVEVFFIRHKVDTPARRSLLHYISLLKELDGKRFSWPMFRYVFKNRKKVFHYKNKRFVFLSHIKHAFRMGRTGVI